MSADALKTALMASANFRAALEQIARLSETADRNAVDVPAMLGDIARAALAKGAA